MRANISMRNYWLLLILTLTFFASSCSSDDTTDSTNDYCYIKSVTLGTVMRKVERRDYQGNLISTIYSSFAGSGYPMTINLRTDSIENRTPLPYGSQLSAVVATITFDGSMLVYREERDKNDDTGWIAYNSTDSLDLTKTLQLKLTSNDGKSSRIYTFKVNVYNQEGDSLYWKQCEKEVTPLSDMTDIKSFIMDEKLMVLGKKNIGGTDKIVLAERSGIEAEGTWEERTTTGLLVEADLQTIRQQGNKLYLSTSDGKILSSTDAKTWTQEGTTYTPGLTLVEKTDKFFYAISVLKDENSTTCKLLRSADATEWEDEGEKNRLDTIPAFLPAYGIRALTFQQANGNTRIVMVGQRDKDKEDGEVEKSEKEKQIEKAYQNVLVWNKSWNDGSKIYENDAEWMYFNITDDNTIPCPRMNYLNLLSYDGKCIAFGGTLNAIYISQDYGITWRPSDELHLPIQLSGTNKCITSTVDRNNYIWIITNAQVWRGRLNRLGFAQQ